jgi:NDP-sugar pyrophosphorylase family protein
VVRLQPEPSDLVRAVWRPAEADGRLSVVEYHGVYFDSGTPADYLRANLDAAGGSLIEASAAVNGSVVDSVIGAKAVVDGTVERCVVLPGAVVRADEHLTEMVRYGRDADMPARLA